MLLNYSAVLKSHIPCIAFATFSLDIALTLQSPNFSLHSNWRVSYYSLSCCFRLHFARAFWNIFVKVFKLNIVYTLKTLLLADFKLYVTHTLRKPSYAVCRNKQL